MEGAHSVLDRGRERLRADDPDKWTRKLDNVGLDTRLRSAEDEIPDSTSGLLSLLVGSMSRRKTSEAVLAGA